MISELLQTVEKFCARLLENRLNISLSFHNISHTREVVAATIEISEHSMLTSDEQDSVAIAAWFHDTGYAFAYKGHELESARQAQLFLQNHREAPQRIELIMNCILATRMPQKPATFLEKILCDADLAHLASSNYLHYALKLRREWLQNLDQQYTDAEWAKLNLKLMQAHSYWTPYGKTCLQLKKEQNITQLKESIQ
jgi:uncharacterized protein